MSVQHRHGTETLDVRQGLFAVVRSPAPIWIDGPQRDVCEEHNRSAGRTAFEIVLKPLQLFVTERPHTTGFQIGHIYETDKMHTLVIEAVIPRALCTLPKALEIFIAVVGQHVMLTGNKVNLLCRCSFECLVERIEFTWLRELAQITGVDDEIRRVRHRIDLVDRRLQSSGDVRIRRFVKADVTVADLHKTEVPAFAGTFAVIFGECPRHWYAAAHGPDQACTGPCHAFQEPATIDTIVVEVL